MTQGMWGYLVSAIVLSVLVGLYIYKVQHKITFRETVEIQWKELKLGFRIFKQETLPDLVAGVISALITLVVIIAFATIICRE